MLFLCPHIDRSGAYCFWFVHPSVRHKTLTSPLKRTPVMSSTSYQRSRSLGQRWTSQRLWLARGHCVTWTNLVLHRKMRHWYINFSFIISKRKISAIQNCTYVFYARINRSRSYCFWFVRPVCRTTLTLPLKCTSVGVSFFKLVCILPAMSFTSFKILRSLDQSSNVTEVRAKISKFQLWL